MAPVCRADIVPRVSAASVEAAFMELAAASPVRTAAANFGRRIHSTLEGLKVLQLCSHASSCIRLRPPQPHRMSD